MMPYRGREGGGVDREEGAGLRGRRGGGGVEREGERGWDEEKGEVEAGGREVIEMVSSELWL